MQDWRVISRPTTWNPVGSARRRLKLTAAAVSQLSHAWRGLVHGWPRCWALGVVIPTARISDKEVASLAKALAESNQCDIDLVLYISSRSIVKHIFDLIIPYAKQIRTIEQSFDSDVPLDSSTIGALSLLSSIPRSSRLTYLGLEAPHRSNTDLDFSAFRHRWKLSCFEMVGGHLGRWHDLGVIKAKYITIQSTETSTQDILTLFRSMDFTEKLWLNALTFTALSTLPEPNEPRGCQPLLKTLRIAGRVLFIYWFLLALDGSSISKLRLEHRPIDVDQVHALPMWRQPTLLHLTDVTMSCGPTTLYSLLQVLPISLLKNLKLDLTGSRTPPIYPWPALMAERLTNLKCKSISLRVALIIFKALDMPALTDLHMEFSTGLTGPDSGLGDWHPSSVCPQLSRISLHDKRVFYLYNIKFLPLISASNLRVLDLAHVAFPKLGADWVWADRFSEIQDILKNLSALSISVPARYTRLRHCFKHCLSLRVLSLSFTAESLATALRLLGKSTKALMLPMLQVLQVTLRDKKGNSPEETLHDMGTHLREVVVHRKARGSSIEELGVLATYEAPDAFVWFSENVKKFKWGNICEGIFLGAPEIDLEEEWKAW